MQHLLLLLCYGIIIRRGELPEFPGDDRKALFEPEPGFLLPKDCSIHTSFLLSKGRRGYGIQGRAEGKAVEGLFFPEVGCGEIVADLLRVYRAPLCDEGFWVNRGQGMEGDGQARYCWRHRVRWRPPLLPAGT